jgi:hypothetical protein
MTAIAPMRTVGFVGRMTEKGPMWDVRFFAACGSRSQLPTRIDAVTANVLPGI